MHTINSVSTWQVMYTIFYCIMHLVIYQILSNSCSLFLSRYSDNTHCFETANFSKSRSTSSSLAKCPIRDEKNESDTWLAKISTYDCIFCKISKSNMYSRIKSTCMCRHFSFFLSLALHTALLTKSTWKFSHRQNKIKENDDVTSDSLSTF